MTGSIRRRRRHSYEVRVYLGRDRTTGKPRWASRSTTSREGAKALLADFQRQLASGGRTLPSRVPVGDFLAEWLDEAVRGYLAASTVRGYENIVRQVQRAPLGAVPLRDLTPQHLDAYYTERRRAGLSGTSVRGHHAVLSAALTQARR